MSRKNEKAALCNANGPGKQKQNGTNCHCSKLQGPQHSPTPLLASPSSWRMDETRPWQLEMETENAILPVSPQSYPPGANRNQIKDIRPKTISKNSLSSASLALALGHVMECVTCGFGNVGGNGHYKREWQKKCIKDGI